jgi:hypothetical protein
LCDVILDVANSMLVKILIIVAVLIAAILLLAATKPGTFQVQRSRLINAPAEKIFPLINDFHNWPLWQPQDKEDASIKRIFSGPPSGIGAISQWTGSGSTGKGSMMITDSEPYRMVVVNVHFAKPFRAFNINEFVWSPREHQPGLRGACAARMLIS